MFAKAVRVFLFLVAIGPTVSATAGVLRDDKGDGEWEIILAPYLWGASMDGTAGFGPAELPVEASFGDILDKLNMGLSLHTEFHRGKWALVIDPTYLSLEVEVDTGTPVAPKADIDIWLVEVWGSYKFIDHWEALVGARYQDQEIEVSGLGVVPAPSPPAAPGTFFPDPAKLSDNWVDWFAGVRFMYSLGERWIVTGRGDISFAGDSDSGYNVELFFNRRIRKTMAINLGYRFLSTDYDNLPTYALDVEQQGFVVGYTWAF